MTSIVIISMILMILFISLIISVQITIVYAETITNNGANSNTTGTNNDSTDLQFPISSYPYGLTWADWSAKWWQWDLSTPIERNPGFDDTGKFCSEKQTGPVWFLVGTARSGVPLERTCTIPFGKAIFFPVVGGFFGYADTPTAKTEADLRKAIYIPVPPFPFLKASVDGMGIEDLDKQWLTHPLFNVTMAKGNILGVPPGINFGVLNGYFVFLKPLPPGNHDVHWEAIDFGGGNFTQNVTYHLTVTP